MDKLRKILWCIEPFPENQELESNFSKLLTHITEASGATIQPITYFHDLNPTTTEPLLKQEKLDILSKIDTRLMSYNIPNLQPSYGIFDHVLGFVSKQTQLIVQYAEENNFDLICLQSKASSNRDSFFIGSFAESMSLLSQNIPLLLLTVIEMIVLRYCFPL